MGKANKTAAWDIGIGLRCEANELRVERTLGCGQVFRYFPKDDGTVLLCSADKWCVLSSDAQLTDIRTPYARYFYRYFDFDTYYPAILAGLYRFKEMREMLRFADGLRILRQDPFETVISFMLSANNNIGRIRGLIEKLCDAFGTPMECGKNAFPTRAQLLGVTADEFRALGCGYRSEYLCDAVPKLTATYLRTLGKLPPEEAKAELCKLRGIGPKVAECILLFAYKVTRCYPVDTWIFKACGSQDLSTKEKVRQYYAERYGELSGYAQQYLFMYTRNVTKGKGADLPLQ